MDTEKKIEAANHENRISFLERIVWYDDKDPARPHHMRINVLKDRLDDLDTAFIVWANDNVTNINDAHASLRRKWRQLDTLLVNYNAVSGLKMTAINAFISALAGGAAGAIILLMGK